MKTKAILGAIALFGLAACEPQQSSFTGQDLMAVDSEFSDFSEANGPYAAWDKFLIEDVVGLPDGQDISWDKATALKAFAGFPETASLTWTPVGGEVAASGEIGYTYGRYVVHSTSPEGEPRESFGKYFTVWKLQADGSWKVVLDGGNSNPAPRE